MNKPTAIDIQQPDENVIDRLEFILERARRGEIHGFVFVGDVQGGASCLYNAGTYHRGNMVGQLELLKFKIIDEWISDKDDTPT